MSCDYPNLSVSGPRFVSTWETGAPDIGRCDLCAPWVLSSYLRAYKKLSEGVLSAGWKIKMYYFDKYNSIFILAAGSLSQINLFPPLGGRAAWHI